MAPTKDGSFRLFTFSGIEVYLHWSWLIVAYIEIQIRRGRYDSILWNALEYIALFLIVLLHEFGHSLACRQVGGKADQIVLWPLGGVAYVQPPPRPGAVLWSIAAGPLVNVVLLFVLTGLSWFSDTLFAASPDVVHFVGELWLINLVLLVFNLLPIYPLDGGQILQSLLWFFMGRAKSLLVASALGLVGVVGLFFLAWRLDMVNIFTIIMAIYIAANCWRGFTVARSMSAADRIPRREGIVCSFCGAAPPMGNYWKCGDCGTEFDLYARNGECPKCGKQFPETHCLFCGNPQPFPGRVSMQKS